MTDIIDGVIRQGAFSRGSVHFERTYRFPMDAVWSAITEPDRIARWLAHVSGDLRVGGAFTLDFGDGDVAHGTILACEAPSHLAVSWEFEGEGTTHLEITLTGQEGATLFALHHSDLRQADLSQYGAGWHTFLEHLGAALAGNPPTSWWARYEELFPGYEDRLPTDSA